MKLRDQLRADAEKRLDAMIADISEAAVDRSDNDEELACNLMTLCASSRTKSLRAKVLSQMVRKAEDGLAKLYNDNLALDSGHQAADGATT